MELDVLRSENVNFTADFDVQGVGYLLDVVSNISTLMIEKTRCSEIYSSTHFLALLL